MASGVDAAAPSLITLPSLEGRAGVDVKESWGCRSLHVLIRVRPQKKTKKNKPLVERNEEPLWREKKDCHTRSFL